MCRAVLSALIWRLRLFCKQAVTSVKKGLPDLIKAVKAVGRKPLRRRFAPLLSLSTLTVLYINVSNIAGKLKCYTLIAVIH